MVEFPDEADSALAYLAERRISASDCLFISMEPSVRAYLKTHGVDSYDTLPFFNNDSHARVLRKSESLVRLMEQDVTFDLGDGIKEAYTQAFVYHARLYLNLILKTLEVLEGIRRLHPETTLLVSSRRVGSAYRETPFAALDDALAASLVRKHCHHHGIPLEEVPGTGTRLPAGAGGSDRRNHHEGILDRLIAGCYGMALRLQSRSGSVLASTARYNFGRLLGYVNCTFPQVKPLVLISERAKRRDEVKQVISWLGRLALHSEPKNSLRMVPLGLFKTSLSFDRDGSTIRAIEGRINSFLISKEGYFEYNGVSFFDEFKSKITDALAPYLLDLCRTVQAQSYVLKNLRPSLIISPVSANEYHSLGEICQLTQTPAIVIPQKTLVEPKNGLEAIEESHIGRAQVTDQYSIAAAQTPQSLAYMRHANYRGKVICTGPLILSKVDLDQRHERREQFFQTAQYPGRIVLYAPSMKGRISSRFYVVETLDEVMSSMAEVVESVSELEDTYLVLRLHPGDALKRNEIETLLDLPANVTIDDGGPFADTLALADVLVSYSSTCTEEAIQNGIPVVLYDKWGRYNHLDAPQVHNDIPDSLSPAYYVTSKAQLSRSLRWVLETHAAGAEVPEALCYRYVFSGDHTRNFYDLVGSLVDQKR